eukprot:gene2254-8036_t
MASNSCKGDGSLQPKSSRSIDQKNHIKEETILKKPPTTHTRTNTSSQESSTEFYAPPTKRSKSATSTPRRTPRRHSARASPLVQSIVEDDSSQLKPYMVDLARRLTKALKTRMFLCWSMYEFFYSSLDRAILKDMCPFEKFLTRTYPNIATVQEFCRPQWFLIRKRVHRPRRFSQAFVKEETEWLFNQRQCLRHLQYGEVSQHVATPPDIPLVLSVGDKVLAKVHKYKGLLSTGMILAVLFREDAYRIAFDREELGIQTVQAHDVSPLDPPRMISSAQLQKRCFRPEIQVNHTPRHVGIFLVLVLVVSLVELRIGSKPCVRLQHVFREILDAISDEVHNRSHSASFSLLLTAPFSLFVSFATTKALLTKVIRLKHAMVEAAKPIPDDVQYVSNTDPLCSQEAGHLRWISQALHKIQQLSNSLKSDLHNLMELPRRSDGLKKIHSTTQMITPNSSPVALPEDTIGTLDVKYLEDGIQSSFELAKSVVNSQAPADMSVETKDVISSLMSTLFAIKSALQEGKSQEEFEALSDMVYERLQQASIPTGFAIRLCNSIRYGLDTLYQHVYLGNDLRMS